MPFERPAMAERTESASTTIVQREASPALASGKRLRSLRTMVYANVTGLLLQGNIEAATVTRTDHTPPPSTQQIVENIGTQSTQYVTGILQRTKEQLQENANEKLDRIDRQYRLLYQNYPDWYERSEFYKQADALEQEIDSLRWAIPKYLEREITKMETHAMRARREIPALPIMQKAFMHTPGARRIMQKNGRLVLEVDGQDWEVAFTGPMPHDFQDSVALFRYDAQTGDTELRSMHPLFFGVNLYRDTVSGITEYVEQKAKQSQKNENLVQRITMSTENPILHIRIIPPRQHNEYVMQCFLLGSKLFAESLKQAHPNVTVNPIVVSDDPGFTLEHEMHRARRKGYQYFSIDIIAHGDTDKLGFAFPLDGKELCRVQKLFPDCQLFVNTIACFGGGLPEQVQQQRKADTSIPSITVATYTSADRVNYVSVRELSDRQKNLNIDRRGMAPAMAKASHELWKGNPLGVALWEGDRFGKKINLVDGRFLVGDTIAE